MKKVFKLKAILRIAGLVALVAIIGFSMVACGDDGGSGPGGGGGGGGGSGGGGSGLVGKWYTTQGMADAGGTPTWEFTSDGRLLYAGSMKYTYTATSDTISLSVQGNFIGTYNYTISANVLTITDPEKPWNIGAFVGTYYKK